MKVWTIDDKLYGIPLTMQPTCLLLNLDLFKQYGFTEADYPKSWDDVRKIAEKVSDPKNNFYGLCLYMENPFHFTQVLQGFGGSWGNGKTIDSEKNEEALQWAIDMFKDGLAVSPTQLGDHWDGETFAANKCLMTTGGVWYYGQMQSAAPKTNYIALPIPQQDWDTPACSLHSSALVILKNCQHKDLASKVAAYMARKDAQKINTDASGAIPSNPELKEEYFKSHTQFTQLDGAEKYAVSFGYPSKTTEFETDFVNAVTAVIYDSTNNTSAKDILSQLQSQYGE
jgi:multiple sugar transport system substrate-binding protein